MPDERDYTQQLTKLQALIPQANVLRSLAGQPSTHDWLEAFVTLHACGQLPADIPETLDKAVWPVYWLSLLQNHPEFAGGIKMDRLHLPPWSRFDSQDWFHLLYVQPQLISRMPRRVRLTEGSRFRLRTRHPDIQLP
jgi:hypothetical protein